MDFKKVELKWQKYWSDHPEMYRASDEIATSKTPRNDVKIKPKMYVLNEFPYPSGSGLHVGHAFSFTGGDVFARFKRMQGYNVLFPMGWDAFGLPTENFAIKMKKKPQMVTKENTDVFRKQMDSLAFSFDWSREVNTTDPNYYKWTQWIFIKLFEAGLAYKKEMPINWCPSCKIGLANEEVVDGKCERCGSEVSRRNISQWVVKITDYADRLVEGLKDTNFIDKVKMAQVNWIGKSEGAKIRFKIVDDRSSIKELEVFTTRPDTLYGVTFMVISPEHELSIELAKGNEEIKKYLNETRKKSEMERTDLNKDKTGVFTGLYAINPVNNKEIPVWISDFVLASYGTGAIMSVPAHDERDFAFAKKFGLPVVKVIDFNKEVHLTVKIEDVGDDFEESVKKNVQYKFFGKLAHGYWGIVVDGPLVKEEGDNIMAITSNNLRSGTKAYVDGYYKGIVTKEKQFSEDNDFINNSNDYMFCYTNVNEGHMINSPNWNDVKPDEAIKMAIGWIKEQGIGEGSNSYHLRDWIFSRQHYWGEPIPMVDCSKCGWVTEKEENLPIVLPEVEAYEPTDDGLSPLSRISEFVNCKCPKCGGDAKRETDTMPNWAGSDWYFLRYIDPFNKNKMVDFDLLKYWGPVDVYIGGDEHNTLHLLYSRFIYQFLYDLGIFPKELPEPYFKRMSHGVILGPDNARMSKSKGNVIVPESVADKYGVDVIRMYLMFMGPFDGTMAWNENTLIGVKRFLDRFEKLIVNYDPGVASDNNKDVKVIINKLIEGITRDLDRFGYNTAIAKLMKALNEITISKSTISKEDLVVFIKLLSPFAPYITEELWNRLGGQNSIHSSAWPIVEEKYLLEGVKFVPVAINGKVRDQIKVSDNTINEAKELENIKKWLIGKTIKKEIYIEGKMVNFVV